MDVTFRAVDRIDGKGNIREHLTTDRGSVWNTVGAFATTLCGLRLEPAQTQEPAGNRPCLRCARLRRSYRP